MMEGMHERTGLVWHTTPSELVGVFRDALAVVAPVLERARISHLDSEAYDDWDRVAEALFASIVARSVEFSREAQDVRLDPYALRLPSYAGRPCVIVRDRSRDGERFIFYSIGSTSSAFDTVRVLREGELSGNLEAIPFERASFSVSIPGRNEITSLTVEL